MVEVQLRLRLLGQPVRSRLAVGTDDFTLPDLVSVFEKTREEWKMKNTYPLICG